MAKKHKSQRKKQLTKTKNIVWIVVGLLMATTLVIAIRILLNVQDYFP